MYNNNYSNGRPYGRNYYGERRENYREERPVRNYNNQMKKMDYLKFIDMSTCPARTFAHYGSFIIPSIGDKVVEDGVAYVVMDRKFNYDEECVTLNIERVEE